MKPGLAEALLERVLLPLCTGGELRPLPPIGRRALKLAELGETVDQDALTRARRAAARGLHAVDELPPLGTGEWLLGAALNDLLQVPNPSLGSGSAADRLLDLIDELVTEAGVPTTALEALCRYATFEHTLALTRLDTAISWWTGSRRFVGARPPERLLAWPELRRVRVSEERPALPEMAPPDASWTPRWHAVLGGWLGACPLLDLATAGRSRPPFEWSVGTLVLLRGAPARSLALRAASAPSTGPEKAARLARAAAELPHAAAREAALDFVRELEGFTGYSGARA